VVTWRQRYALGEFEVAEESQRFLRSVRGVLEVTKMCSMFLKCVQRGYKVTATCVRGKCCFSR
jgi:hypothetical protein